MAHWAVEVQVLSSAWRNRTRPVGPRFRRGAPQVVLPSDARGLCSGGRRGARRRSVLRGRARDPAPVAVGRHAERSGGHAHRRRVGGDRRPRARRRLLGVRVRPASRRDRRAGGGAPRLRLRRRGRRQRGPGARAARDPLRHLPAAGRDRPVRGLARGQGGALPARRGGDAPARGQGRAGVGPGTAGAEAVPLLRRGRDRAGAGRVRRGDRRDRRRRRRGRPAAQLSERPRRLERAGRLGVRRGARSRA